MKKKIHRLLSLATLIPFLMPLSGTAQVEVDAKIKASGYVQSFDSLPVYGAHEWADNVTIPGWISTEKTITGSFGGQRVAPAPGLYSLGDDTAGSPKDRSLGVTATTKRRISIGLRLINKTGATIEKMDLVVLMRQFRSGDASNTVRLWYKVGAPGTIKITDGSGWRELKGGHYDNAIIGNEQLRPVRETKREISIAKMSWRPDSEVLIRWSFAKREGTGSSIGIDNVVIKNFSEK